MWSLWSRQISQPKGCGNGLLCTVSFLATASLAKLDGQMVHRIWCLEWKQLGSDKVGGCFPWDKRGRWVHGTVQSRPEKDSAAAGIRLQNTEHAGQSGQECCQVGLQQNLVYFFEYLIIWTGAALHTHTCCIHFSVWSYKYLQVRYWRDTHAEAWIWSSTSVLAAWFTQWTSAVSGSYFHLLYTLRN